LTGACMGLRAQMTSEGMNSGAGGRVPTESLPDSRRRPYTV